MIPNLTWERLHRNATLSSDEKRALTAAAVADHQKRLEAAANEHRQNRKKLDTTAVDKAMAFHSNQRDAVRRARESDTAAAAADVNTWSATTTEATKPVETVTQTTAPIRSAVAINVRFTPSNNQSNTLPAREAPTAVALNETDETRRVDQIYETGSVLMHKSDYDGAVDAYMRGIELASSIPRDRGGLKRLIIGSAQLSSAHAQLANRSERKIVSSMRHSADEVQRARTHRQESANAGGRALDDVDGIDQTDPIRQEYEDALMERLAALAEADGQFDVAIDMIRRRIKLKADNVNNTELTDHLDRLIEIARTADEYSIQLKRIGDDLLRQGAMTAALIRYNHAIKLKPNNAKFYNNRALANYKINKYELVIIDCTQVMYLLSLSSATSVSSSSTTISIKAYLRRAAAYAQLGMFAAAHADYIAAAAIRNEVDITQNIRRAKALCDAEIAVQIAIRSAATVDWKSAAKLTTDCAADQLTPPMRSHNHRTQVSALKVRCQLLEVDVRAVQWKQVELNATEILKSIDEFRNQVQTEIDKEEKTMSAAAEVITTNAIDHAVNNESSSTELILPLDATVITALVANNQQMLACIELDNLRSILITLTIMSAMVKVKYGTAQLANGSNPLAVISYQNAIDDMNNAISLSSLLSLTSILPFGQTVESLNATMTALSVDCDTMRRVYNDMIIVAASPQPVPVV